MRGTSPGGSDCPDAMDSTLGIGGVFGSVARSGCLAVAAVAFGAKLARLASKSLMASTGWRLSNAASTSGGKGSVDLAIDETRTNARCCDCAPSRLSYGAAAGKALGPRGG